MITQEAIKNLLSYDPETGEFTWLVNKGTAKVGDKAGSVKQTGYVNIKINKKFYLAHRLAWLFVYGCSPKDQIDHVNGIRKDNRMCNLREATRLENSQNRLQAKGFFWETQKGKWHSRITINNRKKHIGYFDTELDARAAYLRAKRELHPFSML